MNGQEILDKLCKIDGRYLTKMAKRRLKEAREGYKKNPGSYWESEITRAKGTLDGLEALQELQSKVFFSKF